MRGHGACKLNSSIDEPENESVTGKLFLIYPVVASRCWPLVARASPEASFEASAQARQYPIAGVVRSADKDARQLTVAHDAIPGLMDGMTMSFAVKEAWAAQVAQPGDRLSATLVVDGARSWIQGVSLSKPAAGADATGSAASATDAGIGPAAGTPLPPTPLRDQAGRAVPHGASLDGTSSSRSSTPGVRCPISAR